MPIGITSLLKKLITRIELKHYLILLSIILLGFFQLAFLFHPFKYDMLNCHFPWRFFISECIRSGEYPFWNPYQFMGSPLHADPQSGVFYFPLYALSLLRRYDFISLAFEFISHIFIAGIGVYKLGKRLDLQGVSCLFMAIAYSLNGFMVGHTAHFSWIMSAAWMPWVFLYFIDLYRKPGFIPAGKLSIITFLFFTGGYPAFNIVVFYLLLIAIVVIFSRELFLHSHKHLLKFLAWVSVSLVLILLSLSPFLVSVFQVLPFLDRASGLDLPIASGLPFHPLAMVSFFFPFSMVSNNYYELTNVIPTDISLANAYIGLLSLVFLFSGSVSKQHKWLSIVLWFAFILFLLISFGEATPLRRWLFEYVPLMNLFRFSGLFRLFAIAAAILLAGLSFNQFLIDPTKQMRKARKYIVLLISALLLIMIYAFSKSNIIETYSGAHNFKEFILGQSIFNRIVIQGIIQIIILSTALFLLHYGIKSSGSSSALIKIPKKLPILLCMVLALDLIAATQLNAPYTSYMQSSGTAVAQKIIHASPQGFPPPSEDLLIQKSHTGGIFKPFDFNINILRKDIVPDGCCSFALSSYFSFIQSNPEVKEKVLSHPWYYAENGKLAPYSLSPVKLSSFSPGEFIFESNADTNIRLIVLQNYYPNWRVTIDEVQQKIHLHGGSFMSVEIPTGKKHITFRYEPSSIKILFWISLSIFILLCVLIGVFQVHTSCRKEHDIRNR